MNLRQIMEKKKRDLETASRIMDILESSTSHIAPSSEDLKSPSKPPNEPKEASNDNDQKPIEKVKKHMKKIKNLQYLIEMMRQDRLQKEMLMNHPNLRTHSQDLLMSFLQGKKPDVKNLKNMPLSIRLEAIERHGLDAKVILSKTEQQVLKLQKDMHIPDQIKIRNLKKLLHTSVTKVNRWIKDSLQAKYQHDFDYYMQNDKTVIDKNSLLYQELIQEQKQREMLSMRLEASKGGYIDPNMRAIDLSQRKVIQDIRQKFQLKKHQLLPIHDEKHEAHEQKLLDIEKL